MSTWKIEVNFGYDRTKSSYWSFHILFIFNCLSSKIFIALNIWFSVSKTFSTASETKYHFHLIKIDIIRIFVNIFVYNHYITTDGVRQTWSVVGIGDCLSCCWALRLVFSSRDVLVRDICARNEKVFEGVKSPVRNQQDMRIIFNLTGTTSSLIVAMSQVCTNKTSKDAWKCGLGERASTLSEENKQRLLDYLPIP